MAISLKLSFFNEMFRLLPNRIEENLNEQPGCGIFAGSGGSINSRPYKACIEEICIRSMCHPRKKNACYIGIDSSDLIEMSFFIRKPWPIKE